MKSSLPSALRGPVLPGLLLLVVGALLLSAVRTENINWDEFALLQRAANFARTGQLQGGGRPGLAEIILAPFVEGCADAIATMWHARALWVLITLAYLGGLWALLRKILGSACTSHHVVLGLGLLTCVPVFPRWVLQVRTDQPALALGMWGAVALIASRRRPLAAFGSGLLVGAGALFSQKVAYVAALQVLLFSLVWLSDAAGPPRGRVAGWAVRLAAWVSGGALALLLYRYGLSAWVRLPSTVTVSGGLETFAHYRRAFGYRAYVAMWPTLLPHAALLTGLAWATWHRRADPSARWPLLAGWSVLGLGLAVGLFHAAAFPYFWLTLGLFPAIAIAVALEPILASFHEGPVRRLALGALGAVLLIQGMLSGSSVLRDTQGPQRDALDFVARAFRRGERGFQPEGALYCRPDPEPFPVYFTESILKRFSGERGAEHAARFMAEHSSRPVVYLVPSHVYGQFPVHVRDFWERHYMPFAEGVSTLGAKVSGMAGDVVVVEMLADGIYRFRARGSTGEPPRVVVGGTTLGPGETLRMASGRHEVRLLSQVQKGMLQWALEEPPGIGGGPFYSNQAIGQITGRLTW